MESCRRLQESAGRCIRSWLDLTLLFAGRRAPAVILGSNLVTIRSGTSSQQEDSQGDLLAAVVPGQPGDQRQGRRLFVCGGWKCSGFVCVFIRGVALIHVLVVGCSVGWFSVAACCKHSRYASRCKRRHAVCVTYSLVFVFVFSLWTKPLCYQLNSSEIRACTITILPQGYIRKQGCPVLAILTLVLDKNKRFLYFYSNYKRFLFYSN